MKAQADDARSLTLEEARSLARAAARARAGSFRGGSADAARIAEHVAGLYESCLALLDEVTAATADDLVSFVIEKGIRVHQLTRHWRYLVALVGCELAFSDSELVLCGHCGHFVWPEEA